MINIYRLKLMMILLFLLSFGNDLIAQSLDIIRIDASSYPKVKAFYKVRNAKGEELRYPAYNSVTVSERGKAKTDSIYCPPEEKTKFSIVLTIDISRSMKEIVEGTGRRKIDLVREAADNIITALPEESRWECAVTTFDDMCEVNQRFTNDRALLRNAIFHDSLFPRGGTDYNSGFLLDSRTPPRDGGLIVARQAKYKPVVIFLTDGIHSGSALPNPDRDTIWVDAIIGEAIDAKLKVSKTPATIYALTLGFPVPDELKKITRSTPFGDYFESKMNFDELYSLLISIMELAGTIGEQPACEITWDTDCNGGGLVEVSVPELSVSDTMSYTIPDSVKSSLELNPAYLVQNYNMGMKSVDFTIRLYAANNSFNVYGSKFSNTKFKISDWGGTIPPFSLAKGAFRDIKINYTSLDSLFSEGVLTFTNNACNSDSLLFLMDAPKLEIRLSNQEHIICKGNSVGIGDLKAVSGGVKPYKYKWTPNTNISNDTILNPIVKPDTTAVYELLVTDSRNDSARISVTVIVEELPKPEILGKTEVCQNSMEMYGVKNFDSTSTFQWIVTGGAIIGSQTPPPVQIQWGTGSVGTIKLIETNKAGCIDSTSITVDIIPIPSPDISGIDSGTIGFLNIYRCKAPVGTENLWSVTGGQILASVTADSITVLWQKTGIGKVYLTQTVSSTGCYNSDSMDVRVSAPKELVVYAGEDKEICLNDSVSIGMKTPAFGGVPPYSFKWTPAIGLNDDKKTDPIAKPKLTTEYIFEVTDSLGTKKYDSILVTVNPLPSPSISGKKNVYQTESATYFVIGVPGHKYKWTVESGSPTGADDADSIRIDWNEVKTGKVKIVQTSDKGCIGEDSIFVVCSPKKKLYISIPDTNALIGEKDFCIPINADNKENISGTYLYDATVSFDASLMLTVPDSTLPIENGRRIIKFNNQNITIINGNFKFEDFCGDVLLPDSDRTSVQIDSFRLYEKSIDIEIKNGSVTINGLCSRQISRIQLFTPTALIIAPNIASDFIEISYPSESSKLSEGLEIRIYDIFGRKVNNPLTPFAKGELGTSSSQYSLLNTQYSLRIDVSSLSPGLYFVRVGERTCKFVKVD